MAPLVVEVTTNIKTGVAIWTECQSMDTFVGPMFFGFMSSCDLRCNGLGIKNFFRTRQVKFGHTNASKKVDHLAEAIALQEAE